MNLQKTVDKYEKDGYAVIPGVFSAAEANRMRSDALMALSWLPSRKRLQTVGEPESPALMFWPSLWSSELDAVRTDARMQEIVRVFLGDDVVQLNNQVYFRLPGDEDEFAWHQDISFRVPESNFAQIEDRYLQTIVVIDEIGLDNSPVEFIPGSHKKGNLNLVPRDGSEKGLRTFERGDKTGVKVTAKPGDVMIWSVMAVHGSEANTGGRMRMTYMNGFAEKGAAKGFPDYLVDGKIAAVDASLV